LTDVTIPAILLPRGVEITVYNILEDAAFEMTPKEKDMRLTRSNEAYMEGTMTRQNLHEEKRVLPPDYRAISLEMADMQISNQGNDKELIR